MEGKHWSRYCEGPSTIQVGKYVFTASMKLLNGGTFVQMRNPRGTLLWALPGGFTTRYEHAKRYSSDKGVFSFSPCATRIQIEKMVYGEMPCYNYG